MLASTFNRLIKQSKAHPNWTIAVGFLAVLLISLFTVAFTALRDTVLIGDVQHPGLQGELLFQRHILHNVTHGNLFRPIHTTFIGFPEGFDLPFQFANSLHLYLTIPWTLLLGPVGGFNMSAIFLMLLNGLTSLLLMRELFSSKRVILFATLLAAANSYLFLKLSLGFHHKVAIFWIPLYLLALVRLWRTRRFSYVPVAATFLVLTVFTYPPYALYAALFTAMMTPAMLLSSPRDFLWVVARLTEMALIVMAVLLFTYIATGVLRFGAGTPSLRISYTPDQFKYRIELLSFLRFAPYGWDEWARIGISPLAFGFGLIGVIRGPRLAQFMGGAALLALVTGGDPIYSLICKVIPLAAGIGYPFRLLAIASLLAAIPAGFGLEFVASRLRGGYRHGLLVAAPLLIVAELWFFYGGIFPVRTSALRVPQAIQQLSPDDTAGLLFLPEHQADREFANLFGFYSALAGIPMVNRYDTPGQFMPSEFATTGEWGAYLKGLRSAGVRRVILVPGVPPHLKNAPVGNATHLARVRANCSELKIFPQEGMEICYLPPP